MRCPACEFDNLSGADECEQCQTSLMQEDIPHAEGRTRIERSLVVDTIESLRPAPPVSVPATATLASAVQMMREKAIGCVLVTGENGKVAGILSERDLLYKVATTPVDLHRQTVAEYMTSDPETAKVEHPLAHAIHRMIVGDHRHLPLVDEEGRPTGIVSSRDIVNYIAAQFRETVAQ